MNRKNTFDAARFAGCVMLACLALAVAGSEAATPKPPSEKHESIAQAGPNLRPLIFEANQRQPDDRVEYLARGTGYTLLLAAAEAVFAMPVHDQQTAQAEKQPSTATRAVRMKFVGANREARITGIEPLSGKINYYIGKDPEKWRTGVPGYAKVKYEQLYPGVDVIFYGERQQPEFDLVVAPGTDPRSIMLEFDGAENLAVDTQGDLVLQLAQGEIRLRKPWMYLQVNDGQQPVAGGYVLRKANRVGFEVAAFDPTRSLVIDPLVMVHSTYFGGDSIDTGLGIAVDANGYVYLTGATNSLNLPLKNASQPALRGGYDAFVVKLDLSRPPADQLVYATYLGGSDDENFHGVMYGGGIDVDHAGNAYVTGHTKSKDFPTLHPIPDHGELQGLSDAFVTKLDALGRLVYSTYLGGRAYDGGNDIVVDARGRAYVTGQNESDDFPVTADALQSSHGGGFKDAFIARLNPDGSALEYSTHLGGKSADLGFGVAAHDGFIYVFGETTPKTFPFPIPSGAFQPSLKGPNDCFVMKIDPSRPAAEQVIYFTYLGGTGEERSFPSASPLAVDRAGNAYVTGQTNSRDFPGAVNTLSGSWDAFVAKLNTTGTALHYARYIGGPGGDVGTGIVIDGAGHAYITGITGGTFPQTPAPLSPCTEPGAFIAKFSPAGDVLFSGCFGGATPGTGPGPGSKDKGWDIAIDKAGCIYVTGSSQAIDFPTTADAFQSTYRGIADAFVTKFCPGQKADTLLFEYAAKLICGFQMNPEAMKLARGFYATAINIHNPNDTPVKIFKKLALTYPPEGQKPGKILPIGEDVLQPDEALEADCDDIGKRLFPNGFPRPYIKGFVIIQSEKSLDVTAVYTTATIDGRVRAKKLGKNALISISLFLRFPLNHNTNWHIKTAKSTDPCFFMPFKKMCKVIFCLFIFRNGLAFRVEV